MEMNEKENIAPISFLTLTFCGLWCPLNLNGFQKMLYSVYTVLMLVLLVTIAFLVLLGVCSMSFTDEGFAETVFLMFALFNACNKAFNVLICRKRFIEMLDMLQEPRWNKPHSPEEIEILDRYSKTTRKISIYFTSAVFIAIALRDIAALLNFSEEKQLPVNAFCPCNISAPRCYWALYFHQSIGTGVATLTHAAKDCLISALLLQTCAQLEILKSRLLGVAGLCEAARNRKVTPDQVALLEKKLISECIEDHQSIFKFAKILNESLNVMLFGQIAVTLPNLCLSIFLLSNTQITSMDFMMTTQFFSAVVVIAHAK